MQRLEHELARLFMLLLAGQARSNACPGHSKTACLGNLPRGASLPCAEHQTCSDQSSALAQKALLFELPAQQTACLVGA